MLTPVLILAGLAVVSLFAVFGGSKTTTETACRDYVPDHWGCEFLDECLAYEHTPVATFPVAQEAA